MTNKQDMPEEIRHAAKKVIEHFEKQGIREWAIGGAARHQIEKIGAQGRLKDAIAQWAAIERINGFQDREIYRKFYLTTGIDVLGALDGSRSRLEFETLAQRIEGWYSK